MNAKELSQLESRMRHAYTKACVAWPRLQLLPIFNVVVDVFSKVSGEDMDDPEKSEKYFDKANNLLSRAARELKNEKQVKEYIGTLPVADKRPLMGFLLGLDSSSMRQVYQESLTGNYAKARSSRTRLLQTRRNLLAISLTNSAAEVAEELRCLT